MEYQYQDLQDAEESANQEMCYRAAKLNHLSPEQADDCDDCDKRCPYCPWRNPLITPADGDQFELANGKLIVIDYVNLRHVVQPVFKYSFPNWRRFSGGRKSYERPLSTFHSFIAGSTVIRRGAKPSKHDIDDKKLAFEIANRHIGRNPK